MSDPIYYGTHPECNPANYPVLGATTVGCSEAQPIFISACDPCCSSSLSTPSGGDTSGLQSQIDSIRTIAQGNTAAISTEAITRANADSAMASLITTVQAASTTNAAAITSEQIARVTQGNSFASQISTVTATTNSKNSTFIQSTAPTAISIGDLWIDTGNGNALKYWNGTAWTTSNVQSGAIAAAVLTETTARTTADSAISSTVTTLIATVNGNTSSITSEATARASGDSALAATIAALTVSAGSGSIIFVQNTTPTAHAINDLWINPSLGFAEKYWNGTAWVDTTDVRLTTAIASISSEATARASADTALTNTTNTQASQIASNSSAISTIMSTYATQTYASSQASTALSSATNYTDSKVSTEASTRASNDSALSSTLTTLSSTVAGNTAAISTEATTRATADGYLSGNYALTVTSGNVVTGMTITSSTGPGTTVSDVIFNAGNFKIYNGSSGVSPFTVTGGVVYMTNAVVNNMLDIGSGGNRVRILGSGVTVGGGTGFGQISMGDIGGGFDALTVGGGSSYLQATSSGTITSLSIYLGGSPQVNFADSGIGMVTSNFSVGGNLTVSGSYGAISATSVTASGAVALSGTATSSGSLVATGTVDFSGSSNVKVPTNGIHYGTSNQIGFNWVGTDLHLMIDGTDQGIVTLH